MRDHGKWGVLAALALALAAGSAAAQQDGDPTRGGELYVENCAVCHGVSGEGRVGANLNQFPGIQVTAALEQTIAEGIEGSPMPAFAAAFGGPLSAQEISDIAAYITGAFHGTEPIAPLPTYVPPDLPPMPDVQGDPSLGAVVYQENCAVCHGPDGRGRIGQTLAKDWPGSDPEAYVYQVVSEGIAGTSMPGWAQSEGGPLGEDEIQNVTAFVLSLEPAPEPTAVPQQPGPINLGTGLIALGVIAILVVIVLVVYYRRA